MMDITRSVSNDLYLSLKSLLQDHGYTLNPWRPIDEGFQFILFKDDESTIVRCLHDPLPIRVELSSTVSESLKLELSKHFKTFIRSVELAEHIPDEVPTFPDPPSEDPDTLIGLCQVGLEDYFGPLVVAGIYMDAALKAEYHARFTHYDLETFHDDLDQWITQNCPHSMIIIPPSHYNSVISRFPNTNLLLSWAQFKVSQSVLKQHDCDHILAPQFGSLTLIQRMYLSFAKKPVLYAHDHALDQLQVQLAQAMAKHTYHKQLDQLSDTYKIELKRGDLSDVLQTKEMFCTLHSEKNLSDVAKLS